MAKIIEWASNIHREIASEKNAKVKKYMRVVCKRVDFPVSGKSLCNNFIIECGAWFKKRIIERWGQHYTDKNTCSRAQWLISDMGLGGTKIFLFWAI